MSARADQMERPSARENPASPGLPSMRPGAKSRWHK